MPSRAEGGASVIAEAVARGVPVVATRVPGNVGMLGADHPGLFPPGDAAALARLLASLEDDRGKLARLRERSRTLARKLSPERESAAWHALLRELVPGGGVSLRRSPPSPPTAATPSRRRGPR